MQITYGGGFFDSHCTCVCNVDAKYIGK